MTCRHCNRRVPVEWSTTLVCAMLGFLLGFLACHKTYTGFESNHSVIKEVIQ